MKTVLTVLFLVQLVGCSTVPHSTAYQVASAGNISKGLHDVSQADMDKQFELRQHSKVPDAVLATGYATKTLTPMAGLSSAGSVGFTLLFGMSDNHPARYTQLLAWMPRTDAADDEAARVKFEAILINAFIAATPDGYTAQAIETQKTAKTGAVFHDKQIQLQGKACQTLTCAIHARVFNSTGHPTTGSAPTWLGDYSGWVWKYSYTGALGQIGMSTTKKGVYPFDMLDYYARVSTHLPVWCYLYVAPERGISTYPVIYHQGKALYFIKPTSPTINSGTTSPSSD